MGMTADYDPTEARLDEFAGSVMQRKNYDFGYPLNQKSKLIGFYKWLSGSGLNISTLDNAGDPFEARDNLTNTLAFEREVIEYFGPLYGFDPGDTWGLVTFSGTDGNNHGLARIILIERQRRTRSCTYPTPRIIPASAWRICRTSIWC